jgi:hypothetical protein
MPEKISYSLLSGKMMMLLALLDSWVSPLPEVFLRPLEYTLPIIRIVRTCAEVLRIEAVGAVHPQDHHESSGSLFCIPPWHPRTDILLFCSSHVARVIPDSSHYCEMQHPSLLHHPSGDETFYCLSTKKSLASLTTNVSAAEGAVSYLRHVS